jgi:hypothetical protein
MLSSNSQHNIWLMDPLENKTVVQVICSKLPRSCRAFRSIPSYLHQFEVQWWLSSVILQTNCLEDVNLRITSFSLCKIKRLKDCSTNQAFYTVCSFLLDFSGSAGFGTWRIFIPLFGPFADVSLLSYCFGF